MLQDSRTPPITPIPRDNKNEFELRVNYHLSSIILTNLIIMNAAKIITWLDGGLQGKKVGRNVEEVILL